jgi:uncharacterized protein YjbI with pentapeptide repeats
VPVISDVFARSEGGAMTINRRRFLIAAAISTTTSQSAQSRAAGKRVSQDELHHVIRLHGMWLEDNNSGQRCVLAGRDLSGLQLGDLGGAPLDLNGADFTQADLSETEADNILVHHCNFNGTKLDGSHWRRPVFASADMRRASARGAEWGTPGRRGSAKRSPCDFSHTALNDVDLSDARICGFFLGAKLARTTLVRADLSFSDFLGPMHYEMSFSQANLSGARFRHCRISSANFANADCSGVDFSRSVFSEVIMTNCNLRGAVLRGTEFERAVFSPYQAADTELQRIMTEGVY